MSSPKVGLFESLARPKINIWASSITQCNLRLFENRYSTDRFISIAMDRDEDGFFSCEIPYEAEEVCYDLEIEDGFFIPDPYADENIGGVHGRSVCHRATSDTGFSRKADWTGVPIDSAVIMEIHVGSFTKDGTYQALAMTLDKLVESGVTAIQLMPLLLTPGDRNWGYDPVSFFTLNCHYGSSDDLKAFIDAAHKKGIAVVLDVVFNHLGPEGNYFSLISKEIFHPEKRTPWGNAINLSGAGSGIVKSIIFQSIEKWMSEFGFDGIRVDAGEYLRPSDDCEFLASIARTAREHCWHDHPILVLEHDLGQLNDSDYDTLFSERGYNLLWNHAFLKDEQADSEGTPCDRRVMTECLAYLSGAAEVKGVDSDPAHQFRFVNFLRSHDTIGNAGRISRNENLDPQLWVDTLPLLLLGPSIPMVFMGDDWMADTPFHFFCDLKDTTQADLVSARSKEFDNELLHSTKPMDVHTFLKSKLDWTERGTAKKEQIYEYFCKLTKIRQRYISPLLLRGKMEAKHWRAVSSPAEAVRWHNEKGDWFTILCTPRREDSLDTPIFGDRVFYSENFLENRDRGFSTSLYRYRAEGDYE